MLSDKNLPKFYLDPYAFVCYLAPGIAGDLIRKIFAKANQGKLVIVSSAWTRNEYAEAIIEIYEDRPETSEYPESLIHTLSMDLNRLAIKKQFEEADVTNEILEGSSMYIMSDKLRAAQALHLFSAKMKECSVFVTGDIFLKLDKKEWEAEFKLSESLHFHA